ncbi:hypothetical protein AX14_005424 [Amanita brunnescens Koide BX004]|nr:hypothetical protein AX14_005424 [Amanita brunnescens Koide BX004]
MKRAKRRRQTTEFHDDLFSTTGDVLSAPTQSIQRHTEIESQSTQIKTSQTYYAVTTARPPPVADETSWRMSQDPNPVNSDEATLDEPVNFVNPPSVIDELEALDDNARGNRILGDFPLHAWIPEIDNYVSEFLRLEGRGKHCSTTCARSHTRGHLQTSDDPLYRCRDCHDVRLLCKQCTIEAHQPHPLHRIQLWNGAFFESISLKTLGLVIQLNHTVDDLCANPSRAFKNDFVILDSHGIHEVALQYCDCHQAVSWTAQLLRARLFPATVVDPKTAATFHLLEAYQLLSFTSKVSGFEFYQSIAR